MKLIQKLKLKRHELVVSIVIILISLSFGLIMSKTSSVAQFTQGFSQNNLRNPSFESLTQYWLIEGVSTVSNDWSSDGKYSLKMFNDAAYQIFTVPSDVSKLKIDLKVIDSGIYSVQICTTKDKQYSDYITDYNNCKSKSVQNDKAIYSLELGIEEYQNYPVLVKLESESGLSYWDNIRII